VNADRLHAIGNEISEGDIVDHAVRLRDNLQQAGNEPGQAAYQTQASEARTALNEALASAPSNDLAPAEREALEELGVADLLGERLREQIETIVARNEITPSAAAASLTRLSSDCRSSNQPSSISRTVSVSSAWAPTSSCQVNSRSTSSSHAITWATSWSASATSSSA
jgi:hypothetical protein